MFSTDLIVTHKFIDGGLAGLITQALGRPSFSAFRLSCIVCVEVLVFIGKISTWKQQQSHKSQLNERKETFYI